MKNDFRGKRVTVMGLGRHGGGLAVVRYLVDAGAIVRVTDRAPRSQLQDIIEQLTDLSLAGLHLGEHQPKHFADAEFVVVNPAVRPTSWFVRGAVANGCHVTSEIEIFLNRCPARVVGVTGACGKSTTATMLAEIGKRADPCVWLGGNIERSLLPDLEMIGRDDLVVLELSSFQLAWLNSAARRPDIVVITNCEPNHLDWHGSYDEYCSAKRKILNPRQGNQSVVLGPGLRADDWIRGDSKRHAAIEVVRGWSLDQIPQLEVPGRHNQRNAALAAAAATAFGFDRHVVTDGLQHFKGLSHRLQSEGCIEGRQFVNDSQATTPAATIAALHNFTRPIWLLAGGASKGAPLTELAATIRRRCRGAAFFGETANDLKAAVNLRPAKSDVKSDSQFDAHFDAHFDATSVPRLTDAVQWLWPKTRPGDVVLLSPACSSRDQYLDYAQRADDFRELMRQVSTQPDAAADRHQLASGLV